MTPTLVVALLLTGTPQPSNIELSDGFYCATSRYLAYETLLHDSPEPHLLHVVSLADPSGTQPERTMPLPAERATALRCNASTVAVRTDAGVVTVPVDNASGADRSPAWQRTRLWGTGSWALGTIQRIPLRRFASGSRITLEIIRVSSGGPQCLVTGGSRVVWHDRDGRERQSRAIFRRSLTCKRAGLTGGALFDECAPGAGRVLRRIRGRVNASESFRRIVSPFVFELIAEGASGWHIHITPVNERRDLTSLIPLHGPSSRDVPTAYERETHRFDEHPFYFHPEVGRSITYSDDAMTMLVDDLRVQSYGRGRLTVTRSATTAASGDPQFRWIEFTACMSFPRQ